MFDSINSAIQDIKVGKLVVVADDEDRENEGDFVAAASGITPEVINFMSKHGRGLICIALPEDRCAHFISGPPFLKYPQSMVLFI